MKPYRYPAIALNTIKSLTITATNLIDNTVQNQLTRTHETLGLLFMHEFIDQKRFAHKYICEATRLAKAFINYATCFAAKRTMLLPLTSIAHLSYLAGIYMSSTVSKEKDSNR